MNKHQYDSIRISIQYDSIRVSIFSHITCNTHEFARYPVWDFVRRPVTNSVNTNISVILYECLDELINEMNIIPSLTSHV